MTRIDIFSDPVCPWCMIGKANLDAALGLRPDYPFELEWHPFQLNPEMPVEGVARLGYLESKFGKARAAQANAQVAASARDAGVAIDFDRIERVPNTLNAHRLIHWAGLEGRQGAAVTAVFAAYWQDGRDIGNSKILADIAGEIGLQSEMIARLLASDADLDAIKARDRHARERGVGAVPTFVIANKYVISGAQPAALWTQVIGELTAQATDGESRRE